MDKELQCLEDKMVTIPFCISELIPDLYHTCSDEPLLSVIYIAT